MAAHSLHIFIDLSRFSSDARIGIFLTSCLFNPFSWKWQDSLDSTDDNRNNIRKGRREEREGRRKFFRYARIFRSSDRSRKCFPLILNSSNDCSKSRRTVAQISPRNSLIIYFTVRDEGDSWFHLVRAKVLSKVAFSSLGGRRDRKSTVQVPPVWTQAKENRVALN